MAGSDRDRRPKRPSKGGGPKARRASAPDPTGRRAKPPERAPAPKRGPKQWGSVARKGAGTLGEDQETASRIWRDAVKRARTADRPPPAGGVDEGEVWIREDAEPAQPKKRAVRPPADGRRRKVAPDVAGELAAVTGPRRAVRLEQRLADAARAFERERYPEARRILQPLAKEAPGAASVRELYGLTLYNLGKWSESARELEAYRSLSGSPAQHPVLADAYRALRRYKKVDELWEELREASPSAELVAEGRIVAAGSLADRGDLRKAIALLERGRLDVKRPRGHHLRMMYALADLYERVGDVPRARDLFRRVLRHDRDFFDVADRVKSLQ